ncbi:MAG: methyltransferase domain-containing protein [Pseudomonadota bacterium]
MILSLVKKTARAFGVDTRALYQNLSAASLRAAIKSQNLEPVCDRLRKIVPDLRGQYTIAFDEAEYRRYWEIKMRGLHAWQTMMALDALARIGRGGLMLADIGDSSGNHGLYLGALAAPGMIARFISVNLDPVAVAKVQAKGGESILSRAEDLDLAGIRPDLFLSFETIEHLTDPVRFLHALAEKGSADWMLVTVPYRRASRFGGAHLRQPESALPEQLTAEEVHIYEFSPEDWSLLARFAGWRPVETSVYRQYPSRGPWRLTAPLWRILDFEGFFGMILTRDLSLARRYSAW